MISPILANVYLHYALDLWFEKAVRPRCQGEAYMVRYADDFVCCFQYEHEAEQFYTALIKRLGKFNLEVAQDKTRIIAFGRNAASHKLQNGGRKPDTFDFLGFTHYCSKSRKGWFRVKRKTSRKKLRSSIHRCKIWLKANLNTPTKEVIEKLYQKLIGYYRYYCITDNSPAAGNFQDKVRRMLFRWFNRRSQRKTFNWEKYVLFLKKHPMPRPKVYVNIYDIRPELLSYLK
ncbi:MAG: reverse transcriptase domain-containing protein [Chloroflexota bacterium]